MANLETANPAAEWSPVQAQAAQQLPAMPPMAPWMYAISDQRWRVDGDEIVPDLITVSLEPGVNHTGPEVKGGMGQGEISGTELACAKRGLRLLNPGEPAAQAAFGGSYIVGHPVAGGRVFLDRYVRPIAGSARTILDAEGRRGALVRLRDALGLTPPEYVLEDMLERLLQDHGAAASRKEDPRQAALAAEYQRQIDVIRQALSPAAPPTPKRGRKVTEDSQP